MSSDGLPPTLLPALREGGMPPVQPRQRKKENSATGLYAATVRALSARILTFYFRAPIRAFFKTRVE